MHYRGSTIHFPVDDFKDANGDPVTPTSVKVKISYKADDDGAVTTELLNLVDGGDGTWLVRWDSIVARPGAVDWSVLATDGTETIVDDGQFVLSANRANPAT